MSRSPAFTPVTGALKFTVTVLNDETVPPGTGDTLLTTGTEPADAPALE